MRLADDITLFEVTIFDCNQHRWMQGGVTGDNLFKALANFTPSLYATHSQIERADDGTTFRWDGWLIRIHGDDGTTITAGPQIYRKLTFVGTHDTAWTPPQDRYGASRGTPSMLYSLLRDEQREGSMGASCLVGNASALRDQIINILEGHLVPIGA
jgi:hypothetical protein